MTSDLASTKAKKKFTRAGSVFTILILNEKVAFIDKNWVTGTIRVVKESKVVELGEEGGLENVVYLQSVYISNIEIRSFFFKLRFFNESLNFE